MLRFFLLFLSATSLSFGAEKEAPFTHVALGDSESVSFAIPLKKDAYQALSEQLRDQVLTIDEAAIARRIKENLEGIDDLKLGDGETIDSITEELLKDTVLPVLEVRVEKFNDLLNSKAKKDEISAGFLAFSGLAKGMASTSEKSIAKLDISGTYHYRKPNFYEGRWEWWDSSEETSLPDGKARNGDAMGTTGFHKNVSGTIEEEIEFDLEPYGTKKKFMMDFSCSGEVKLEQRYSFRFVWPRKYVPQTGPITTVRVEPIATVTATKTTNSGSYFRVDGAKGSKQEETLEKVFEYPAILEFRIEAEKP